MFCFVLGPIMRSRVERKIFCFTFIGPMERTPVRFSTNGVGCEVFSCRHAHQHCGTGPGEYNSSAMVTSFVTQIRSVRPTL